MTLQKISDFKGIFVSCRISSMVNELSVGAGHTYGLGLDGCRLNDNQAQSTIGIWAKCSSLG